MPTERIAMRRAREMLKLKRDGGLGVREIARRTGAAPSTLREMYRRFEASELPWPLPLDLTDADLEARLYGTLNGAQGQRRRPEPDWGVIQRELKRKHVTLQTLWEEYDELQPGGYRYSRFCALYRAWEKRLPVTMRQVHLGGDKLFVDYAGDTVPVVVDRHCGKIQQAHLFVAVMGGSSLTFAQASWTETLPDWIDAHVQAFTYFGGAARLLVPDNAKVAVIKACLFEPTVNRTYLEMADHYGAAVMPARPYRPRDKPKVETAVRIVERWLLGRLRRRRFYNLADVNLAIAELLTKLNDQKVLRYVRRTRRQLFEEIDAPLLKILPVEPYALSQWYVGTVWIDYHVEVDSHFYSVPHRYVRAKTESRVTARTVEIFLAGERIATHIRGSADGKKTTVDEHMPSSHRRYKGWTVEKIHKEALRIGPSTATLCQLILESRPHPEQGYRSCYGIVGLARSYSPARVEAACDRGLSVGARTYGSIKSILVNNLDGQPVRRSGDADDGDAAAIDHPNIRGSDYYH